MSPELEDPGSCKRARRNLFNLTQKVACLRKMFPMAAQYVESLPPVWAMSSEDAIYYIRVIRAKTGLDVPEDVGATN